MKLNKRIIAGIGLGALALIGGTFAYYNEEVSLDNLLRTGQYENELIEDFTPPTDAVKPGATIDKKVGARNTGTYPILVRISMSEVWSRGGEEIISHNSLEGMPVFNIEESTAVEGNDLWLADQIDEPVWTKDYTGDLQNLISNGIVKDGSRKDNTVVRKELNDTDWVFNSADGYWYYTQILQPKGETGNLLESLTIASNIDLGKYTNKDYYAVGGENMDKSEVKEDDWNPYTITTNGITVNGVDLKDLNNDGMVDAIDLAKHLKEKGTLSDDDKSKNKLFRKNESLLDESLPGYANANYTLTVRSEFVQATPEAIIAAFGNEGKIDRLPAEIQTIINTLDLNATASNAAAGN